MNVSGCCFETGINVMCCCFFLFFWGVGGIVEVYLRRRNIFVLDGADDSCVLVVFVNPDS